MIYRNANHKLAHQHQSNIMVGVVEDRADPEMKGRVRVRVFGVHSDDPAALPTAGLPWATVLLPCTSPGMNGMGQSTFLLEGSWVAVMFMDMEMQQPLVLGSIAGRSTQKLGSGGFGDPRGHYPRNSLLGTPDTHLRARGESDPRLAKHPLGGEPDDPYAAQYPYNHVFESESGHIMEFDDTPGHERVSIWHRSGSGAEIHPNGDMQIRAIDQYDTCSTITVGTDGDIAIDCGGSARITVQGEVELASEGDMKLSTKGDFSLEAEGDVEMTAGGELSARSVGPLSMRTSSSGFIAAGGSLRATSVGSATIAGSTVNLNPPGLSPSDPGVESPDLDDINIELGVAPAPERYRAAAPLTELQLPNSGAPSPATAPLSSAVDRRSPTEALETARDISDRVRYVNQNAARNLPLVESLEEILKQSAEDAGVWVDIVSGGQKAGVSRGVVGSHRHDDGYAADVRVYSDAERTLLVRTSQPSSVMTRFVARLRENGATSVGAGPGYIGGAGLHVDIAQGNSVGQTASSYWGAGGRAANAPDWLRSIFT